MEAITTLATMVGYAVLAVILLITIMWPAEIVNEDSHFSFTYFEFGFLYAKSEALIVEFSKLRKVERQQLFINAPFWFNKYIYNFGIRN